jgi:hypothetical protein
MGSRSNLCDVCSVKLAFVLDDVEGMTGGI